MEILMGIVGICFALWIVSSCKRKSRESIDYGSINRNARVEHYAQELIDKPRDEKDAWLLRLDEDERLQLQYELQSEDADWRPITYYVRDASPSDYQVWMDGFLKKGGKVTHRYDYKMPKEFKVATSDFDLPAWYGAMAVSVIVPAGINVRYKNLGHNNIYKMSDFSSDGHGWIPAYRNIKV